MSVHLRNDQVRSRKYKRDGAKYVCNECKARFFSKEEVEKCYDAHASQPQGQPAAQAAVGKK